MAGRRRRMGKSAYRLTARRRVALRRAQLISARKRRKNNAIKVGILAAGITAGVLGTKYGGSAANIAKDIKNRGFRFNNPANKAQTTPAGLEANMLENAVSPAAVARQAPPVKSPSMGSTSSPRPNKAKGGFGGAAGDAVPGKQAKVTPVASAGQQVDPYGTAQLEAARDPNQRKIHPLAKGMTKERIQQGLIKAGVNPADATWREIAVLAEVQAEYLNRTKNAGFKVNGPGRGNKSYNQYYRSLLDIMEIPSAGDLKRAQREGKA